MRNLTAAFAVVLIHAAAISVLLSTRELLLRSTPPRAEQITYWIRLPQAPAQPAIRPSPPQRGLPMLPMFGGTGEFSAPALSAPAGTPALTVLPSLALPPNSTALTSIGEYFACSFVNYEKMTDAERQRCAIALSDVGPYTSIESDYADSVGVPFRLFGARGSVIIAAATRPYLDFSAGAGCGWSMGVCRPILPPTFGIDPDDQTRGSILAQFDLGSGFNLYAGAQDYMQNFLGGARPIITTGVRVTYRW